MAENGELDPSSAVSAYLRMVASASIAAGILIFATPLAENKLTPIEFAVSVVLVVIGSALFAAAQYWKSIEPWLAPRLAASVESVALDFRYWVAFFWAVLLTGCLFFFLLATGDHAKVITQARALAKVQADFNCYVEPRHLTPKQISIIAHYLSAHKPQTVTFNIAANDDEASDYRADIDRALRQGGWKISGYNYINPRNPCLGTSRLNAVGFAQVPFYCLAPGSAVLCTQESFGGGPKPLSCSRVAALGAKPADSPSACSRYPCFVAAGSPGITFNWQQSTYPTRLTEGLTTTFRQTPEHARMQPDPKHPNALALLSEAFKRAHVQIDGGSGGSGQGVKHDALSINIGPRRRDGHGWGCRQIVTKQELVPPVIPR